MPNTEVDDAFAALSSDAERGLLLSGPELRRQAGKRHNRGLAVTLSAVAVIAVAASGAGWSLANSSNRETALPPAENSSPSFSPPPQPSSSAPPSSSPSLSEPPSSAPPPASAPPTAEGPPLPKSIPAKALLTKADSRSDNFARLDEARGVPEFCSKAKFPSRDQKGVSASVQLGYRKAGTPAEYIPDDLIYDTVTVFRGQGAQDYLGDLRRAVQACPSTKDAEFDSLGSLGLGDESLMIKRSFTATDGEGNPVDNGSKTVTFIAAVRIDDAVTLVESVGYENLGSEQAEIEKVAKVAAGRLDDWR
ncbi:hypothetical protein [Paractinoplanes lichenicola]|uniref:PknH-like extracellular domain-containing protein n=1 Tax=Paractinoplanes lichenicola TaxID=2802976 RepID=A0ABS1VVB0_9ACTN|nr:hypothetical protein [Actinoplanes lichenicola]MBL7258391.1 hypothetical protein [Actinoplanes lichenicola]